MLNLIRWFKKTKPQKKTIPLRFAQIRHHFRMEKSVSLVEKAPLISTLKQKSVKTVDKLKPTLLMIETVNKSLK